MSTLMTSVIAMVCTPPTTKKIALFFLALLVTGIFALAPQAETAAAKTPTNVHTITLTFKNIYVISQADRAILIDSGGPEDPEDIEASLREIGIEPENIKAIVITHGHHDHAGGALHFQKKYGTTLIGGAGDLPMFRSGRNDRLCPTNGFARLRLRTDQAGRYAPTEPDILVRTSLDLENLTGIPARVFALPGHTPGSLVITAGQLAFVGDLLRGTVPSGRAARHFYICDPEDNTRDIQKLLVDIAPEAAYFLPGHLRPMGRKEVVQAFGIKAH